MNLKTKLADTIFIVIFILYNLLSILIYLSRLEVQSTSAASFYKYFQYLTIGVLFFIILLRNYKINQFIMLVILLPISMLTYYTTHEVRFLMFTLFCFASIGICVKGTLKKDLIVRILSFTIIIIMHRVGILGSLLLNRYGSGNMRDSMGFGHPNYGGTLIMTIVLEWLIVRFKKITIIEVLLLSGISIYFNNYFQSRTSFLLSLLAIFGVYVIQYINSNKIEKVLGRIKALKYFPILLTIMSLSFVIFLKKGTQIYNLANKLLSSRLDIFSFYYSVAGIHWLPQRITYLFQDATFVGMDNSYIFLGIYMGLIALIGFCLVEIMCISKLLENNNIEYLIIVIIFLVFGLTEALAIFPVVNFSVIFFLGKIETNEWEKIDEKKY
ncbi:hypothetical protein [Latilactobacillus sakei]|uniref:hypothetical protein n=1 Tax=Latilactobacillus sakei TaxID=1599 RepID=UPI003CFAD2E1